MRAGALLALMMLSAAPALGQVRYDHVESGGGGAPRVSWDMTVGRAADRYLVVVIGFGAATPRTTAVTFGGASLGFLGASGDTCRLEMWGMAAPPSGTFPLAADVTTPANPIMTVSTAYSGVDQRDPIHAILSSSGATSNASLAPISTVGEMIVDGLCVAGATSGFPVDGPGQTVRTALRGSSLSIAASDKAGGFAVSSSWGLNGGMGWAMSALSLRAAGAPADAAIDAPSDAQPDARERDAALAPPDAPSPDAPPDVSPPVDASAPAVDAHRSTANLAVGCACRAGGGGDVPVLPLVLVLGFRGIRARASGSSARVRARPGR